MIEQEEDIGRRIWERPRVIKQFKFNECHTRAREMKMW